LSDRHKRVLRVLARRRQERADAPSATPADATTARARDELRRAARRRAGRAAEQARRDRLTS
jgi:hypothetical protein